jgi:hypothetical protein
LGIYLEANVGSLLHLPARRVQHHGGDADDVLALAAGAEFPPRGRKSVSVPY